MGSTSDLQGLADDQLTNMLSQCAAKRTRSRRVFLLGSAMVFVLAVVSMWLSVDQPELGILLGIGLVALLAAIWQRRSVRMQRTLDKAVIESRRRGLIELAVGVALEPLDGTGYMPRIMVLGAVSLVLASAFAIWGVVFFGGDEPYLALALLGMAIMACLVVSTGWMAVLYIRAGALKARPDRG